MSLTRSLPILRSLSPRYSVLYCYERLSSSSGGADEPRPPDWVPLLEEKFKRKFDDFRCEFKELSDKINIIQAIQPMGLRFTSDWVLLHVQEFDKLFANFMSDYKKFKNKSVQITASEFECEMQPMVSRSVQDILSDVDEQPPKQWEDFRIKLNESKDRTATIQSMLYDIKFQMRLVTVKYSSIIHNTSTSDTMKELKNLMNVLKDFYCKFGKSIMEHPDEYYRFHDEWRATTQKLISVLAFVHWMETGSLLLKSTAEENMGFEPPEFYLDLDDYLFGLCLMSDDLTRYASGLLYVGGNRDSLPNIVMLMKNMEDLLGMLDLPNGKLRRKFDGVKRNVRKVDMLGAGLSLKE